MRESHPPRVVHDGLGTHLEDDLDGDEIDRKSDRPPDGGGTIESMVVIIGSPFAFRGHERHRLVEDKTCRGEPVFHRRRIDERFESGSRLTKGHGGAVEFALVEVAAADQGANAAACRIEGDDRDLGASEPLLFGYDSNSSLCIL